jgi:hypothetical protein
MMAEIERPLAGSCRNGRGWNRILVRVGSCQAGRDPLRIPRRMWPIDLAVALSGVSTSGEIRTQIATGLPPDPLAASPRPRVDPCVSLEWAH